MVTGPRSSIDLLLVEGSVVQTALASPPPGGDATHLCQAHGLGLAGQHLDLLPRTCVLVLSGEDVACPSRGRYSRSGIRIPFTGLPCTILARRRGPGQRAQPHDIASKYGRKFRAIFQVVATCPQGGLANGHRDAISARKKSPAPVGFSLLRRQKTPLPQGKNGLTTFLNLGMGLTQLDLRSRHPIRPIGVAGAQPNRLGQVKARVCRRYTAAKCCLAHNVAEGKVLRPFVPLAEMRNRPAHDLA